MKRIREVQPLGPVDGAGTLTFAVTTYVRDDFEAVDRVRLALLTALSPLVDHLEVRLASKTPLQLIGSQDSLERSNLVNLTASKLNQLLDATPFLREKNAIVRDGEHHVLVVLGYIPTDEHRQYFEFLEDVETAVLVGGPYGPRTLRLFVPGLNFEEFEGKVREHSNFVV